MPLGTPRASGVVQWTWTHGISVSASAPIRSSDEHDKHALTHARTHACARQTTLGVCWLTRLLEQLKLEGSYMQVRFENVSAKEMHFNVGDGFIIGKDIITTDPTSVSTFTTVGADMILTTTKMTSVQMKQDSGNLVCLTAANNSLFVDDRRQTFCNYIDSNSPEQRRSSPSPSHPVPLANGSPEDPSPRSRRVFSSRRDHTNFTVPQFGPLEMCPDGVTKKRDVKYVPGCTDMTFCKQSETEQCLCRPICDLVEPEDLCFDGICGVAGKCDVTGKCCRLITRDFTTADMFPEANQPRDGTAIDAILYPWQPNNLEQKWRLHSVTGQVAVTALQDIAKQYRVSSYRLEQPVAGVLDQDISIPEETKALIDKLFHPSGSNKPREVVFEFMTSGPGLAEREQGSIFWILSQVYLVLPSALLDTFSVGLIKPLEAVVEVRFNPAFCPAYVDEQDFAELDRRLVLQRQKLLDALQDYPPHKDRRPLPMSSMIIFKPAPGGTDKPKGFKLDLKTNRIVVDLVYAESYTLIFAVLYFSIAFALSVSLVIVCLSCVSLRRHLKQLATQRYLEEETFHNITYFMHTQKTLLADQRHGFAEPGAKLSALASISAAEMEGSARHAEIRGYTDFFFMLENFLGDPQKEGTTMRRVTWAIQSIFALMAPLVVIWFFSSNWRLAYLEELCKVRADREQCLKQREPLAFFAMLAIVGSIGVFTLELSGHYLHLSYTGVRPLIRHLFFITYGVMCCVALCMLLLVCLWILLGVLLLPSKTLPYAAGLAGIAANAATIWAKLRCFQHKVARAVAQRMEIMRPGMTLVPPPLLDTIMRLKLAEVLRSEGLTAPLIALAVLRQLVIMLVIFVFLFIAFASFTDPYDLTAGVVNTAVISVVAVAFNNQKREDTESPQAKEHVYEVQERLSQEIFIHLEHVYFQIKKALVLYQQMRKQLHDQMDSDDSDATETSMSFITQDDSSQGSERLMPPRADSPDGSVDLTAPAAVKARLRQIQRECSDGSDVDGEDSSESD